METGLSGRSLLLHAGWLYADAERRYGQGGKAAAGAGRNGRAQTGHPGPDVPHDRRCAGQRRGPLGIALPGTDEVLEGQ